MLTVQGFLELTARTCYTSSPTFQAALDGSIGCRCTSSSSEKYYDVLISRMLVVCIHPDCADAPFVDEVPDMQADVRTIMEKAKD